MAKTLTPYTPEMGFTRLPDMIDRLFRESWVVPTYFDRFFDGMRPVNLLETEKADLRLADPLHLGADLAGSSVDALERCPVLREQHEA